MDIEFSEKDINKSYRIGKPSARKKRPIIVKFVRNNDWRNVFSNKDKLKDSAISITEILIVRWKNLAKRIMSMVKVPSRKMEVPKQNYFMVKWNKSHV